jgi:hypothetical protein
MTFTFVEIYGDNICQVLINRKYSNAGKSGPFGGFSFSQHFLTIGLESQCILSLLNLRLYVIPENGIPYVIT